MTTKTSKKPKIDYYVALPEGVKVAKNPVTKIRYSQTEFFPLTALEVGDSFYVPNRTARSLRGILHKRSRTQGMKFVSRTIYQGTRVKGARAWRVR